MYLEVVLNIADVTITFTGPQIFLNLLVLDDVESDSYGNDTTLI